MMCETVGQGTPPAHERVGGTQPLAEGGAASGRPLLTIHFPRGLPGFSGSRDYELAAPRGGRPGSVGPFLLLRGCGQDAAAFVTVVVQQPDRLYGAEEIGEAAGFLHGTGKDLLVLLMVGRGPGDQLHVNMRAPIFIDVDRCCGAQLVLSSPHYPLRAPLQADP